MRLPRGFREQWNTAKKILEAREQKENKAENKNCVSGIFGNNTKIRKKIPLGSTRKVLMGTVPPLWRAEYSISESEDPRMDWLKSGGITRKKNVVNESAFSMCNVKFL